MSLPRITTVVGAGLGGLILGQCLKAKNIPATILEKASSSSRFNYGVTLQQSVYQPLLRILQMNEASFLEKCSIGVPEVQVNSATTTTTIRCHRGRLEGILREGLDIRWEQCLKSVKMTPQEISLHVENGPTIASDTIIGADGVHSQLRKSFIPSSCLNVLPYVVFNGRRSITLQDYKHGLQQHMAGQTIIHALRGNVLFRVYVNEYTATHVCLGYTYSRPARANDQLYEPYRPTTGAENIPEEFYAELSLFKQKELGQGFADIFDSEKVRQDRVLHWLMRSSTVPLGEIQDLAVRGVWLIGDAAHPTPILGGEGANKTITDAIELVDHLSNGSASNKNEFLEKRHQEWRRVLNEGERRLSEMHGLGFPSL
ncbi:hypothetical protein HO133_004617 [Letharia lupina]|uniref:FAD-binding domain-containing protein n=1 Tax=Letharia lupina TaxID=560253 RepID=A0A8H6FKP6_9LECA|nr:uncharacterized protein HO133_004617 [Letharia lupina]KAF6230277.1 hypothetical protein HO133_004617 [Letharia lupina]